MYKSISQLNLIFKFIILIHYVLCIEQLPDSQPISNQISINEDANWQLKNLENFNFQQIPGIAFNNSQLSIFHRSTVIWNEESFDSKTNVYKHQNEPITVDPVLTFSLKGDFINSWGKNYFFMPHGLSFDPDGNVWLTDVALHQVFRFNKNNLTAPDLVLGERFKPGKDGNHFCKPTDVQVSRNRKLIYVSDGYCNSRIAVFSDDGKFVKEFGLEHKIEVSHSLSLIEELDLVCVADREHSKVYCYNAGIQDQSKLGEFKKELKAPSNFINGGLYAIQNIGTNLFAIEAYIEKVSAGGLLFDLTKDKDELIWQGDLPLNLPHDITFDNNGNLYISEIERNVKLVKKFTIYNLPFDHSPLGTKFQINSIDNKPKSKRIDDTRIQEEDLKNLATTTISAEHITPLAKSSAENLDTINPKSRPGSLLLFLVFVSSFIFISAILFALKKRIGIENYFRGLPTKLLYSKDLHINDPERLGFNLLREDEENLFDFELENNSSESEVEEFNFKHVRNA